MVVIPSQIITFQVSHNVRYCNAFHKDPSQFNVNVQSTFILEEYLVIAHQLIVNSPPSLTSTAVKL